MFANRFDSVVMLTWSDWKHELRSNRYHYASHFRRVAPVLFVQPDLPADGYSFETTELEGITILHLAADYASPRQAGLLAEALRGQGFASPLLWIYNAYLHRFILSFPAAMKIYHATEDYFSPNMPFEANHERIGTFRRVIQNMDLLVACSEGVLGSYRERGGYRGRALVLENGCDYSFYAPPPEEIPALLRRRRPRVAIYQGGINRRLDFQLLDAVAAALPDWIFWFCGAVAPDVDPQWQHLLMRGNIVHHGAVSPERLRELGLQATVGLIPFVQEEYITERSLPLKAYEYAACGLPVVSVPIRALEPYRKLFHLAGTAEEFAREVESASARCNDESAFRHRLEIARQKDYDGCFKRLVETIETYPRDHQPQRLKVLVLYDDHATGDDEIRNSLGSWIVYSRHDIFFAPATNGAEAEIDLAAFDAVVLHNSIRTGVDGNLSSNYMSRLKDYVGLKILVMADDLLPHDSIAVESSRRSIEEIGVCVAFTSLDLDVIERAFPRQRFPTLRFVNTRSEFIRAQQALGCEIKQSCQQAVESEKVDYCRFIDAVDDLLSSYIRRANPAVLQVGVMGVRRSYDEAPTFPSPINNYFMPSKDFFGVSDRENAVASALAAFKLRHPPFKLARRLGKGMPEFVKRPIRHALGF